MIGISEQLNAAVAEYSRGDFGKARARTETALRAQPNNPSILQLLGVICAQSGDAASGIDYFKKAIANGGDTADNRLNLAKALVSLGRHYEAEALCEGPIASASPDLQRMRADIFKATGRVDDANALYEDLTLQKPDDFESWNNLGNVRHERGDLEGALSALQQARQLNPNSSLVHINMSRVLVSMDRYEDACLMMEKASLLAPQDVEPLLELGRMLTAIDHPGDALNALGAAARLDRTNPKIFAAIGLALTDLSELGKAEQAYRFALQVAPASAAGYLDLGLLLEKANRLDELGGLIGQARSRNVAGSEIDYLQALALNRKGDTAGALALARSVSSSAIHPATIAQFIGQLSDKLGLTGEAFQAFEDMNQAMAQTPLGLGVDRSAYQRGIDGLNRQTTSEWYHGWKGAASDAVPPSPAFLVGFPRSGTTLLDTILMGHSDTFVLEEIPIIEKISQKLGDFARIADLDDAQVAEFRALYFDELDKVSPPPPGKLIIDKNPLSMIRIPLIHRLFPDAKIILAMRHPCDVVLSCYMQNFKPTEAMSSFLDLTNASRTYDRIFAYWEKCRDVFPIDVHMLRYEAMVEDVSAEVRPLFDFLGLPWKDEVLDHQKTAVDRGYIRTPSYAQVTERIYSSASGRWTRYRDHMAEALAILQPWIDRFGYRTD